MFARLYNVKWHKTGRDRPVMPMASIRQQLDASGAGTSPAWTDFRYIKRGALQLPGVASDQDYRANYLIYSNDDIHYFGAWVESIDWASSNSFVVTFNDDLFTTFAAGASIDGYITRKIYEIPSRESPGDLLKGDMSVAALWGMSLSDNTFNPVLLYINVETEDSSVFRPRGIVSTPLVPVLLQTERAFGDFMRMTHTTSFDLSLIVSAFVLPWEMLNGVTTGLITFDIIGGETFTFDGVTDSGLITKTIDIFANIDADDRILLNSHDAELVVRLGKTSIPVPIDYLTSGNFRVIYSLSPFPSVVIVPDWDSKIALFNNGAAYGYGDFPQIPMSASTFEQWAIKNALPAIGSAAITLASGSPTSVSSAVQAVSSTVMTGLFSHFPPDVNTGSMGTIDAAGRASVAIQLSLPKDRARARNYYRQFGYPCSHRESFDLTPWTVGANYGYYQSTDNVIYGAIPTSARDEIDAMLKSGVRCWSTVDIGGYPDG